MGEAMPADKGSPADKTGQTPSITANSATGLARIWTGTVGLTKFAMGKDRAPDAIIQWRKSLCMKCPHLESPLVPRTPHPMQGTELPLTSRCALCKCFLHAKAALFTEKCPAEKW